MDVETANMLWGAITILEAQEMLIAFKVADFPNAKDGERNKIHRQIHRLAYPSQMEKPMSMEELKMRLMNGG